jgi:hypothetical protein
MFTLPLQVNILQESEYGFTPSLLFEGFLY